MIFTTAKPKPKRIIQSERKFDTLRITKDPTVRKRNLGGGTLEMRECDIQEDGGGGTRKREEQEIQETE